MLSTFGWGKYVYNENYLITIDRFGTSAPSSEVLNALNFDNVFLIKKFIMNYLSSKRLLVKYLNWIVMEE